MPSCVVKWCPNNSSTQKKPHGITYHGFPQNPKRRKKWTEAVRLERQEPDWCPSKFSRICSIHFDEHEICTSNKGYIVLRKTAIPICTMVRPCRSTRSTEKLSLESNKENNLLQYENLPLKESSTSQCLSSRDTFKLPLTSNEENSSNLWQNGSISKFTEENSVQVIHQFASSQGTLELSLTSNKENYMQYRNPTLQTLGTDTYDKVSLENCMTANRRTMIDKQIQTDDDLAVQYTKHAPTLSNAIEENTQLTCPCCGHNFVSTNGQWTKV